jgi:hypothetical protein
MGVANAFACVILELGELSIASDEWEVGPFPFSVGSADATKDERLSYFRERSARVLFGSPDRPVRWHRSSSSLLGPDIDPVELLAMPDLGQADGAPGSGVLVMHVRLGQQPAARLAELRKELRRPEVIGRLIDDVGVAAVVPSRREVLTLTYVGFDTEPRPVMPDRYRGWPPARQWLWTLASGNSVDDYPPDAEDPTLFDGEISLSASWRALVLRQGVAFVTTRPVAEDSFLSTFAPAHVRTIYLDTLLLGLVQRSLINQLADEVAHAALWPSSPATVRRLNRELLEFRAAIWRQQITTAGHANRLLMAYQQQNLLPQLLDASASSIADLAANLQDESNLRASSMLGLIALVGFPMSIVLTGVQVLGVSGWGALAGGIVVGGLGAASLAASRPGREILGPLAALHRRGEPGPSR